MVVVKLLVFKSLVKYILPLIAKSPLIVVIGETIDKLQFIPYTVLYVLFVWINVVPSPANELIPALALIVLPLIVLANCIQELIQYL